MVFPGGDVIEGAAPALRPSRGDFTSLSVGGRLISSLGSALGGPPDSQDGAGITPPELNADYSSSTLDGGYFPATVTGFGSVDPLNMNDQKLFDDSDHVDAFSVSSLGSWSLGASNLDRPNNDPTTGRGSAHCSSDGSTAGVIRCETEENLDSFMTTSPDASPDAPYQSAQQSPNFPGPNAPAQSPQQILTLEMMAAQNIIAMAWPSDTNQGPLPQTCDDACDASPPVDGAFAPASDFVNLNGGPNSDPTADPLFSPTADPLFSYSAETQPSIPEIPPTAMLLIGFAGLALLGSRRRWGSARLG